MVAHFETFLSCFLPIANENKSHFSAHGKSEPEWQATQATEWGKGEELQRAWEKLGEEERTVREMEQRVEDAATRADGLKKRGTSLLGDLRGRAFGLGGPLRYDLHGHPWPVPKYKG